MKKIFLLAFITLIILSNYLFADSLKEIKRISEGNENAKITIIAYESLTCGPVSYTHLTLPTTPYV